MSERILRALMQLFAIIARADEEDEHLTENSNSKNIVESFLRSELNASLVDFYLKLYEEFLSIHKGNLKNKIAEKKRTSVNSVKVLRICSQINEELTQRQKVIVLFRIIEFIHSNPNITDQENDFITTVSESFNVSKHEFHLIKYIQKNDWTEKIDDTDVLYITSIPFQFEFAKNLIIEGLDAEIRILRIKSINTLFFRYFGNEELVMNGQIVSIDRTFILNHGSSIKTLKSKTIYYSDVITRFLEDNQFEKIRYHAKSVEYKFKNGIVGLHKMNILEESGKLLGIMGGSGTGKSTLLNIFNGNIRPTSGSISINGVDIHTNKEKLEGVIGYISQDDLLIEELTVFQNLYFNTKLCFGHLTEMSINKKVIEVLNAVGLFDVKELKVGNVLDKTISGGQRKRLNIALELIREPSVLFVDEPTSGLSSRDSENIMDLLKELALKGKLIFVVIHQPSSDIFKMFDRLLVLDKGGFPIFDGNPLDSLVYFKTHIHHVNAEERECTHCGNVNPEQIFNIIDAKVVDEFGNFTNTRKTSPNEWNQLYTQYQHIIEAEKNHQSEEILYPVQANKYSNKFTQYKVFFIRDVLSKLGNLQYILINSLVAPILALILSSFVRYYKSNGKINTYTFFENENIPQYLFISVIVALFLGLIVAAEEIHKDKKILKREEFLNLSRSSYLVSKISILFIISAIQSLLFVLIGNYILGIQDLYFSFWLVLFSISCLANLMGLNISSAFNSAKVIYIMIPLFIIPQLLLSGVIIKFDKLNPTLSKKSEVPFIGNLMASRWAYEAIITKQATENQYSKKYFNLKMNKSKAAWKKDYWIQEMKNNLNAPVINTSLLINEIKKEESKWSNLKCENCITDLQKKSAITKGSRCYQTIDSFLNLLNNQYIFNYNTNNLKIDALTLKIGAKKHQKLQNKYTNESIIDLVSNKREIDKIIVTENELIQKNDPIYLSASDFSFFDTPFYCSEKYVFEKKISTFWANIIILWGMTIITIIALYFDWMKGIVDFFQNLFIKKINL